jgi:hypothetical protein
MLENLVTITFWYIQFENITNWFEQWKLCFKFRNQWCINLINDHNMIFKAVNGFFLGLCIWVSKFITSDLALLNKHLKTMHLSLRMKWCRYVHTTYIMIKAYKLKECCFSFLYGCQRYSHKLLITQQNEWL